MSSPERKKGRILKRAGMGAAAVALATGVLDRLAIDDAGHHLFHETAAEKTISDALQRAFGDTAIIHCVDDQADVGGGFNKAATEWEVVTQAPVAIRLMSDSCSALQRFAQNPHKPIPPKGSILALHLLAHEKQHALSGISKNGEGQAECYAVQEIQPLTQAFGATSAEAGKLQKTDAASYTLPLPAALQLSPNLQIYAIPPQCRPGGELDLHIAPGQTFPLVGGMLGDS